MRGQRAGSQRYCARGGRRFERRRSRRVRRLTKPSKLAHELLLLRTEPDHVVSNGPLLIGDLHLALPEQAEQESQHCPSQRAGDSTEESTNQSEEDRCH